MPDTIPVGKYYNFDNKNVDVVYKPAKDENKGGSGGGSTVVNMTVDGSVGTADKTVAEIYSAAQNGCVIFVANMDENHLPAIGILESIRYDDSRYQAYLIETAIGNLYARTESDYPSTVLS